MTQGAFFCVETWCLIFFLLSAFQKFFQLQLFFYDLIQLIMKRKIVGPEAMKSSKRTIKCWYCALEMLRGSLNTHHIKIPRKARSRKRWCLNKLLLYEETWSKKLKTYIPKPCTGKNPGAFHLYLDHYKAFTFHFLTTVLLYKKFVTPFSNDCSKKKTQ